MASINETIRNTYKINEQIKELGIQNNQGKERIRRYFEKHSLKSLEVLPVDDSSVKVKVVARISERMTMAYIPEKLKENLEYELFNEISSKTLTINDMQGLVKFLKCNKIKRDEFMKFVCTTYEVDKDKIKQLYETGEIKPEMLKGCYNATISKCIQVVQVKGDKN